MVWIDSNAENGSAWLYVSGRKNEVGSNLEEEVNRMSTEEEMRLIQHKVYTVPYSPIFI